MNKVIGAIVSQFKSFFKALPPLKRNVLILSAMVAMVGLMITFTLLTKKDLVPLFTNIASDQMPTVLSSLQTKNIPFRMGEDGKSVMVPRELLPATQMALMEELGADRTGTMGLELFEKQDFGVTSYAQKIQYQRAIQGELMRSINTLSAIKRSKVLLALPGKKTFLEEGSQASASVVLELHPGKSLNKDQVKGITNLVASAVEGMTPEKVTVVDELGKVLSRTGDAESGLTSDLLELKRLRESEIEERIESILSKVVGAGKVIARVEATLNQRKVSSVEETVDPDSTAIRSQVTEEESLDGARTNPAGLPGARANLPGAQDQGQVGFNQNVRKELKTTNFSVPKTIKKIEESAGDLTRLSVAVLVDGITTPGSGKEGEPGEQWKERAPEELVKYESIIKNAIGFNAARGDQVKIENIRFEKEDFTESTQILSNLERRKLLHALFKWSLLGMSLALFFFVVVKPFMRWITDSFQDSVEDMLPRTIEELEELQSGDNTLPGMTGALPVLEDSIDPNKAESELLKERIMALVEQDVEKTSAAFNMWVAKRDS